MPKRDTRIAVGTLVVAVAAAIGSARIQEPWDLALVPASVLLAGTSLLLFLVASARPTR